MGFVHLVDHSLKRFLRRLVRALRSLRYQSKIQAQLGDGPNDRRNERALLLHTQGEEVMSQILSIPIGSAGSLVVSESAGIVRVQADLTGLSGSVKGGAFVEGSAPALLKLAADAVSNPMAKALLAEAAVIAAALPA